MRRTWADVAACTLSLVLLFYTHLLTFGAQVFVLGLLVFWNALYRRRPGDLVKYASLATAVAALTAPWLIVTGYLAHRSVLPRAWPLMNLPEDTFRYASQRPEYAVLLLIFATIILLVWFRRHRLPDRITVPVLLSARPVAYLSLQMLVAAGFFVLLMPAASLFWGRLSVILTGPCFLLAATFMGALARAAAPRHAIAVASGLFVIFLAFGNRLWIGHRTHDEMGYAELWRDLNNTVAFLEQQTFCKGTRLYSSPNDHLLFTYMTGLPVQSIAPVRKTFLDQYPGPIVFLDRTHSWIETGDPLYWEHIQQVAADAGYNLSPTGAERVATVCMTYLLYPSLSHRAARVLPELDNLPPYTQKSVKEQAILVHRREEDFMARSKNEPLILRGHPVRGLDEWWPVFFYRFVDPARRIASNANYAVRMSNATATVIEGSTEVFFLSSAPSNRSHNNMAPGNCAGLRSSRAERKTHANNCGRAKSSGHDSSRPMKLSEISQRS